MSSSQTNFQAEYKSIKAQYDSLLEKNQNDLIKIKQKEKQLNEELARLQEENRQAEASNGERVRTLLEEIENERRKNERGELTVDVSHSEMRIKELEMDVRGLMDSNIELTSNNTALKDDLERAKEVIERLNAQNARQKEYILSVEQEYKQFRAERDNKPRNEGEVQTDPISPSPEQIASLQQNLQRAQKQLQHLSAANQELKQLLKHSEQQGRMLSDRQRKAMQLLKRRQQELSSAQAEVDKLKAVSFGKKRKTETSESLCLKCKDLQQQIHLLKQMVKSTKGMVRVREIQAQKYRLHDDPNVRDNRSAGKVADKPSTLPPLRKKQGE